MTDLFPFLHSFLDVGWQKKAQKVENKKHWVKQALEIYRLRGFQQCQCEHYHYSKRLDVKSNVLANKSEGFGFYFFKESNRKCSGPNEL